MSKFNKGDRVVFNTDYAYDSAGTKGVVTDVAYPRDGDEAIVYVTSDIGTKIPGAYAWRLDLVEDNRTVFKAGDIVQVKDTKRFGGNWSGPMPVIGIHPSGSVHCDHPQRGYGAFEPDTLELVPVALVEEATEPQPVVYRICVGNLVGTTDYPSEEAAKQAGVLHGKEGEEFSVYEMVKVAEFRVKVSKTLEAC